MSSATRALTRDNVLEAHSLIRAHIHRTPVLTSTTLSTLASTPLTPDAPAQPAVKLHLKAENFQRIGAFKIRGATHALERLSDEELKRGVVTHSSGNHAQALALAAREMTRRKRFEVRAYVVMPTISTPSKVQATKDYGAEVVFSGSTAEEREEVVKGVQERTGAVLVPPYDHRDIILGQGTAGLELLEDVGEEGLDAVLAPCGGGGLLAGTAVACKGMGIRVYGAEPGFEGADDCARGLREGKRVESVRSLTVADGLRTPVGKINWEVISDKEYVNGVFTVGEEEIKNAMRLVLERCKIFIEPSSAVAVAVVLYSEEWREELRTVFGNKKEVKVGIILSGGNTTIEKITEVFGKVA